jgi:putative ABC transport system permease protein
VTRIAGQPLRAVVRWSLRLFRREWRQQFLVLLLLAIAVAAAVATATIAVNGSSAVTEPFGGATARITIDGSDSALADRAITAAEARFGTADVTAHRYVTVPGTIQRLDVRDQDPAGPYSANLLDLRAGRYPTQQGDVALTDAAADLLDAELGDQVALDGERATVIGLVENPANLGDDFALVAHGTLAAPDELTVLVDATDEPRTSSDGIGFAMEILGNDVGEGEIAAMVLAATTLALSLVGLLASAGFVVIAHRRQRQLGMLVAIGATDRHVRAAMLATGAITGVVAAGVGGLLGVAGWFVAAPAVESAADHRIDRFALPWALLAGVLALAVIVAMVAAWWPARMTARVPMMAALSGRPVPPRPVQRPLVVAGLLAVAGTSAIAIADPLGQHVQPVLFVAGLLAVVLGTVLAAPAAVRAGGRLARRLPFAPRVALRDLARHQARAAAALGAITLGLAVSIGIVAVAAANEPPDDEGDLSSSELLVLAGDPSTAPRFDTTAAELAELDQRAADVIAAVGDDVGSAPLDVAMSSQPSPDSTPREPVGLGVVTGPSMIEGRGVPYVATPELLELYGIDPGAIEPGIELLTSRDEPFVLVDFTTRPDPDAPPTRSRHVELPTQESAPNALITQEAMARHDWQPARFGWIVESSSPLTDDQVRAARRAAASVGLAVQTRSTSDGLAALRNGATLAGMVLAVVIVSVAVGLIRSEARRDLRTLTATGASSRTRRALTASTAGGLAVPGVLLALGGAYLALLAAYRTDLGRLVPIPVDQLVPLVIGTPLAATAMGWLFAGREPRAFARQELE